MDILRGMNPIDIVALLIILGSVALCFKRGLILSVFRYVSFIMSLVASYAIYPVIARLLKATFIYDSLKAFVMSFLDIDATLGSGLKAELFEAFSSFPLPDILRRSLAGNNNPDVYQLLNVSTPSEYVAAFLATIIINAIAFLIALALVGAFLAVVSGFLSIVKKLPVIGAFDKTGGIVIGIIEGVSIIFLLSAILSVILSFHSPVGKEFSRMLDESVTARLFMGPANIILQGIIASIP